MAETLDDKWIEFPDIFEFVKRETFIASTTAMVGEHFFRLNPDFFDHFWDFDWTLLMLMKRLPSWLVPKAYRARDKCRDDIMRWHSWAMEQIDPADKRVETTLWNPVWGISMMSARAKIYRSFDFSPATHASMDLGMIWA